MEKPTEMDDLGVPLFSETSISIYIDKHAIFLKVSTLHLDVCCKVGKVGMACLHLLIHNLSFFGFESLNKMLAF